MSRTTKLAFKFLRELNSSNVRDTFDSLGVLLDHLERKNDPEPFEMQMVDTAYQALEQLKTLEGLVKRHIGEADSITKGNVLQKLYDKPPTSVGSSILD